jgi:hypothetical protein
MRCRVYSREGQLISEGMYGLRRDGSIEMVPDRTYRRLHKGDGPLVMVEGRREYQVRVDDVHGSRDERRTGPLEIYHLAPVNVE